MVYIGCGDCVVIGFYDGEVVFGECGDLGEMGYCDDLRFFGELGELLFYFDGCCIVDVGVDFVEDECGNWVGCGDYDFDC